MKGWTQPTPKPWSLSGGIAIPHSQQFMLFRAKVFQAEVSGGFEMLSLTNWHGKGPITFSNLSVLLLKSPRYPLVCSFKLKGSHQNQVMSNPPLAVPATIVKPLLALPACRLSTHLQPILLLQPPVQVQNPYLCGITPPKPRNHQCKCSWT